MESFERVDAYKLEPAKPLTGYAEPDGHPGLHSPQMISCFKIVPTYTNTHHYIISVHSLASQLASLSFRSTPASLAVTSDWSSQGQGGRAGIILLFSLKKKL